MNRHTRLGSIPAAAAILLFILCWGARAGAPPEPPLPPPPPLSDQPVPPDEFSRGQVLDVSAPQQRDVGGLVQALQQVRVRIITGVEAGRLVDAVSSTAGAEDAVPALRPGEHVVVATSATPTGVEHYIVDRYRLPPLGAIFALFFGLAILLSRWRGCAAVGGLFVSILVLAKFIVPQILAGRNPLLVSLGGALLLTALSIFPAHGFSRRTTIAAAAALLTLGISAGLAALFVDLSNLFGAGTEEAFYLQIAPLEHLNLRGLLLGGILLGALGVLDDITTSQAAAVDEIRKANPALSRGDLYRRGLAVGQEHITSLVNTLVLAYAGASLPLFLLFALGTDQPLWVTLNSEFIAEEVVRTLVGSIALILAVPITTALAAYWLRDAAAPSGGVREARVEG